MTESNTQDVTMVPKLLTGEEETVYGVGRNPGAEKREDSVHRNISGKKDQVQDQTKTITKQESFGSISDADQAPRTSEIIRQGKG